MTFFSLRGGYEECWIYFIYAKNSLHIFPNSYNTTDNPTSLHSHLSSFQIKKSVADREVIKKEEQGLDGGKAVNLWDMHL